MCSAKQHYLAVGSAFSWRPPRQVVVPASSITGDDSSTDSPADDVAVPAELLQARRGGSGSAGGPGGSSSGSGSGSAGTSAGAGASKQARARDAEERMRHAWEVRTARPRTRGSRTRADKNQSRVRAACCWLAVHNYE